MVSIIVSCSNENKSTQITNGSYTSSQTTSEASTSLESSTVTNPSNTTSKKENPQEEDKTSSNNTYTSIPEETSSTSSKNSSSVVSQNTNVSSKNTYKQPTDSDNNITVDGDGIVSITIPKWFLLKMEPDFNYQLTDKEINEYKFINITKNADGSATYKIGYNDYHRFLLISQSSVNAVVYKYKHNIWFSKTDADAGYNNIKIYTKYDSLDKFDNDFGVYIAMSGLQTTFYQYINYNYSVSTTITVYNKDNVLLETYNFPDLLK